MRHRGDGAAWARCNPAAIIIYSLPLRLEIAEAGKATSTRKARSQIHAPSRLQFANSPFRVIAFCHYHYLFQGKVGILPVHTVSLWIRREMWRYSLSEKQGLLVCGCAVLLVCPQSRLEQTPLSSTTLLLLITTSFTETIQWPRDAVQTLPSA